MKRVEFLLFVISFSIMFISCEHEPIAPLPSNSAIKNNEGNSNEDPCDSDTAYFVNDIFPIISSNCAFSGCHGNGSSRDGVELSTYNSIITTADVRPFDLSGSDLYKVITESDPNKRMPRPPANQLSQTQISLIAKWINQGAKNNSCSQCDTTNVTFTLSVSPIIKSNCQGCHNGVNPGGGIVLTNYTEIKNQVVSGKLDGAVNHRPGFIPMPYNQPKLNDCNLFKINKWINEGALNN
ncbi:MAG: hypothetical protein DWP98_02420 [Bacteroidetes bacterium]|nr:MAG: hypothetical protein DWP98_02420 [Bacteroidota bacterium]